MIEINRDWMSVGDSVEAWLNNLLCLDATTVKPLGIGCPHPEECDL
jgi:N-acetyltransferase 10